MIPAADSDRLFTRVSGGGGGGGRTISRDRISRWIRYIGIEIELRSCHASLRQLLIR